MGDAGGELQDSQLLGSVHYLFISLTVLFRSQASKEYPGITGVNHHTRRLFRFFASCFHVFLLTHICSL